MFKDKSTDKNQSKTNIQVVKRSKSCIFEHRLLHNVNSLVFLYKATKLMGWSDMKLVESNWITTNDWMYSSLIVLLLKPLECVPIYDHKLLLSDGISC